MNRFAVSVLLAGCTHPAPPPAASAPTPPPSAPAPVPTPTPTPTADENPEPATSLPDYVPGPMPPPRVTTTPVAPPPDPVATPAEEKACAARGGKMQPVCMLGNLECVIRYRDGGKRCRDKSECIGQCLYEGPQPAPANAVGACERTSDPCGCKAPMFGGRARPSICGD